MDNCAPKVVPMEAINSLALLGMIRVETRRLFVARCGSCAKEDFALVFC